MMNVSSRGDAGARSRVPGWLAPGAVVLLVLMLAAACGASRTAVRSAPVGSLSGAIDCSLEEGEELGFEALSVDRTDHRVVLERTDRSVRRSDPSFQRAVGQLTVERAEGESAGASALAVEARTFHEFFDRRGRTRRQRDPSDRILAAADSVLDRCASAGTSAMRGQGRSGVAAASSPVRKASSRSG